MRKFDRAKYDTMASTGNFGVNGVNGNPSAGDGKIKRCHHCNSDKHLKHACPKLQRLREGRRVLDHKSKVDRKRKRDESDSRKPCRNLAMGGASTGINAGSRTRRHRNQRYCAQNSMWVSNAQELQKCLTLSMQ